MALMLPECTFGQQKWQHSDVCTLYDVNGVSEVLAFDFSEAQLDLSLSKSGNFELQIPIDASQLTLSLEAIDIYSPSFLVTSKKSSKKEDVINYQKAQHFKGFVKGSETQSSVSLNIRNNIVSGLVRFKDKTYTIAYSRSLKSQYIFESRNIDEAFELKCEQILPDDPRDHIVQEFGKSSNACSEAVDIYFECDHNLFLNFNSDTTLLIDYVVDMFTEVFILYGSENLPVQISQISIWTSLDPYADNNSGLYDFEDELNNNGFNGDLAHLLTNDPGANGGLAYVDELCGNAPYAYSDLTNSYNFYPAWSWDVQVVAHELGHNFGRCTLTIVFGVQQEINRLMIVVMSMGHPMEIVMILTIQSFHLMAEQ